MKRVNLNFLIRDNEILLAMKKRGFGVGKWNGVGGKAGPEETFEQAAIRETEEEIGVKILEQGMEKVGMLDFHFSGKPDWDQQCAIYLIRKWEGEPQETEEMKPQWFALDKIPFEKMWIDDPLWLPQVLAGKKIKATFHFNVDGSEIEKQDIAEVASF
jgi:ADP-ribose pyrophosphatase YjhB (NUDIX family)